MAHFRLYALRCDVVHFRNLPRCVSIFDARFWDVVEAVSVARAEDEMRMIQEAF